MYGLAHMELEPSGCEFTYYNSGRKAKGRERRDKAEPSRVAATARRTSTREMGCGVLLAVHRGTGESLHYHARMQLDRY